LLRCGLDDPAPVTPEEPSLTDADRVDVVARDAGECPLQTITGGDFYWKHGQSEGASCRQDRRLEGGAGAEIGNPASLRRRLLEQLETL
jgi:hypothetical protein